MGLHSSERVKLCALLLGLVLVSSPALAGSWIYDDWTTAQHPAQDGFDDLIKVFSRDSSAYIVNDSNPWPMGVTYRPLSMASLIVVQAIDPNLPWAHHLVSLLLHVTTALGLYFACRSRLAGSALPVLLTAGFALHPVTIEAYAWINGRSDVLAGAFVAGLAWALSLSSGASSTLSVALCGLCAAGAAFAKEPAVAAVGALAVASVLPTQGLPGRSQLRTALPAAAAALSGASFALAARAVVTHGRVSGSLTLLADPQLLSSYAATVRLSLEHLLIPLPRSMLCLGFELHGAARPLDTLLLTSVLLGLVVLLWRRYFRASVLIAGALVSLVPVLMVRHLVWLGFDRYLYLPLLLLCLAALDLRVSSPRVLVFARRLGVVGSLLCGLASFGSARAYADQESWLASLVRTRPDDPSGYIMTTAWFLEHGDLARAESAVLRTPRSDLSPALAHDLVTQLARLGHTEDATLLAEQSFRESPESRLSRYDALQASGLRGQLDRARELARLLGDDTVMCKPTRALLEAWLREPRFEAQRTRLRETLDSMPCAAP